LLIPRKRETFCHCGRLARHCEASAEAEGSEAIAYSARKETIGSQIDRKISLAYFQIVNRGLLLRSIEGIKGQQLADSTERRQHHRINVAWPLSIVLDEEIVEGETINVTSDGVLISCNEPLQINEVLRISINPPNRHPIEVNGKVIWSDHYAVDEHDIAFGIGICFMKISDVDRRFLQELVSDRSNQ